MWARLDDGLFDHPKLVAAGTLLGKNGPAIALGIFTAGLLYSGKHLTDGVLPLDAVRSWFHADRPLIVADALIKAGLWERKTDGGFRIHHYADFNPSAAQIREKRQRDRRRKQQKRTGKPRKPKVSASA